MVRNLSYNNPSIIREVEKEVGEGFSWLELLKSKGAGSPRLELVEASKEIADLLNLDNNLNYCNAEIRSKGVIFRFRSILETYGLIVPFHKLSLYKSDSDSYSIFCGEHKIKVRSNKKVHAFMLRLMALKIKHVGSRIEDL